MRQFFRTTQDASIYEEYTGRNAGHDEILEVGKSAEGTKAVRSLMQFDVASISESLSSGMIPSNSLFELKLFVARADDLRVGQTIELNEVSRSWVEGSGYYYQNTNVPYTASRDTTTGYTENDGVTWKNRQSGSLWSVTGSEFIASPTVSGTIADPVEDMTFDISEFVRSWVSGTIPNNGLLLKFPTTNESDTLNAGNIRFFSRQTHTVYAPVLTAKYNNQVYVTGSISGSNTAQTLVTPRNLQPKYRKDEIVRVDLSVRDRYPLKTFNTVFSNYAGNQRLPQTSYFSIVDVQSNATIIPFDDYSRVNCDGSGSYFDFQVQGMYPGRYYKVKIKVVDALYTRIFDLGHHFSIEQN
jgi:hypothetical protein